MSDLDHAFAGKQIGNYRLIKRIGRGGFADVYLGEHIHLHSRAAIKLLPATFDRAAVENFRREARILSKLRHPNIITLLEFGVDEQGQPYLIMDYAPGGSLHDRYPRGMRVPLPTILDYVDQAAAALDFAHNTGFIHRDIKPANLLIGQNGELLISDFGVARIEPGRAALASNDSLRQQSLPGIVGTAAYIAPEQLRGKAEPASDQYALATIVYQWLCGRLPFESKEWIEIMWQRISRDPEPPRAFNAAISKEIEDVVMTGLAREPQHRYASVRAFAGALIVAAQSGANRTTIIHADGQHVPGVDTQLIAPERSRGQIDPPAPINNRAPASGADPSHLDGRENGGRADPASVRTRTAIPPRANAQHSAGVDTRLIAPDRSTVRIDGVTKRAAIPGEGPSSPLIGRRAILGGMGAVIVAAGLTYGLTHWALPLHGAPARAQNSHHPAASTPTPRAQQTPETTPTNIPAMTTLHIYSGHTDIVDAVAWSPDGHYIVSGSRDRTAQVWDANSAQHVLTHQHGDIVSSVTWSSDSQSVASGSFDKTAQIWSVSQEIGAAITYSNLNKIVSSVSWSPLANRVAASALDGDEVDIFDSTTGNPITSYHLQSDNTYAVAWSHDGMRIATGSGGGVGASVQVWDVTTNSRIAGYTGHVGGVFSVAWSPDGRYVASGGYDKTVRIWEIASGNQVQMYEGHHDVVNAVAWSPDGRYLASASKDRTVQIWTAAAGIILHTYSQHLDSVRAITWSPDGTRIASASNDKTVRVWQSM